MKATIKSNTYFLLPYFVFLIIGGVVLSISSKVDIHLAFNFFHTPFFDTFFSYFTYLGDGLLVPLMVVILLTVKYRYALMVGFSNLVASLITQVLKQTLFSNDYRPKKYFENIQDLYFVPGVDNHLYYSFPSGHATCAFALYFSLALIVKSKMYKFLFFVIALLIGYSRIYLSQHFLADVYVGSLIGVIFTYLVYTFFENKNATWLNRSIISSAENK